MPIFYINFILKAIWNYQMSNIEIKIADFHKQFSEIEKIRTSVFIIEQKVPLELEWDEFDDDSTHVLAYYDTKAVATARLLKNGYIGRMAVLAEYRDRTIGSKILNFYLK